MDLGARVVLVMCPFWSDVFERCSDVEFADHGDGGVGAEFGKLG